MTQPPNPIQLVPPPSGSGSAPEEEIDLRELIDMLAGGGRMMLAGIVASLAVACLYLWLAAPIYQVDAMVQVEPRESKLSAALGDMAELIGNPLQPVTAEIEILQSRLVLGKVVDELHLDVVASPRYFRVIGRAVARMHKDKADPLGMKLGPWTWGAERIVLGSLDVPPRLIGEPMILRATADGYDLFDEDRALLLKGKVGEPAHVELADGAISIFVRELVAHPGNEFWIRRTSRGEAIKWLSDHLTVAEKGKLSGVIGLSFEDTDAARATEVVNAIARAYLQQNVERRSAEAEQTLAFLSQQMPKVKDAVEASEGALSKFRLQQGSADLTKETELILQQSVALETQRLAIQQKRTELMQRFTPNHPMVQALDAQTQQIEREQALMAGRVKNLPETQQDLLRLSRDAKVNSELYTSLLNSSQQLQVAKAGTIGNVRVIDFALQPGKPARPSRVFVLVAGSVGGVFLGLFLIFVQRALHHGVDDPAVVEKKLGLSTYATVPYTAAQAKLARQAKNAPGPRILAQIEPGDPAIEALRSLRTSLHFALVHSRNNVIAVTGPAPNIGKSFITTNLGAVLATTGKKVVIVDADMRKGHLHDFVGGDRAPGLSDYIAGTYELDAVVRPSPIDGLSVIAMGAIPPNPAELLLHERFASLVDGLSKKFDLVLIDTPPALAVTDAAIIAKLAGSTLIVLLTGEHTLRSIEETARRLRLAGAEVRGTVFNQVGLHGTGRRYAYDYGYGYKYEPAKK